MALPPIPRQHEIFAKSSQGWPHPWTKRKCYFSKDLVCSSRVDGKMHDSLHKDSTIICSKSILELLHVDLFHIVPDARLGGKRYCLVILDDYSRYT